MKIDGFKETRINNFIKVKSATPGALPEAPICLGHEVGVAHLHAASKIETGFRGNRDLAIRGEARRPHQPYTCQIEPTAPTALAADFFDKICQKQSSVTRTVCSLGTGSQPSQRGSADYFTGSVRIDSRFQG